MADVQISLKWDFDHYVPITNKWNEWKRATEPCFFGRTNADGQADVGAKYTVLDSTWGPTPPSWRDRVTGQVYLVRVEKDKTLEEHSLIMRPGESVRGKAFTVHVVEIQRPRYVKTGQ